MVITVCHKFSAKITAHQVATPYEAYSKKYSQSCDRISTENNLDDKDDLSLNESAVISDLVPAQAIVNLDINRPIAYNYTDLRPDIGPGEGYFKYIGRIFDDVDDERAFKVIAVCDIIKVGGRRSTNIEYAFKYISLDGTGDDYIYTPAREMLNSCWCKWRATFSSSATRATVRACVPSCTSSSDKNETIKNSKDSNISEKSCKKKKM